MSEISNFFMMPPGRNKTCRTEKVWAWIYVLSIEIEKKSHTSHLTLK
jgi:hypothetical protein